MGKKNELVVSQYEDMDVFFMEDGWFNATEAAKNFGRDLKEWFKLPSTKTYINELCKMYNENNNFQMGENPPIWKYAKSLTILQSSSRRSSSI